MLRIHPRWHDAANGPLHGEARLLWFAGPPGGHGFNPAAPNPADPSGHEATPGEPIDYEKDPAEEAQLEAARIAGAEQELNRRRAHNILQGGAEAKVDLKSANIVASAKGLQAELETHARSIAELEAASNEAGESNVVEIQEQKKIIAEQARRINDLTFALSTLRLEEWERGDMTPTEFLHNFSQYVADMDVLDAADTSLSPQRRAEKKEARERLLDNAKKAVAEAHKKMPQSLPHDLAMQAGAKDERELWTLTSKPEKDKIIDAISDAAGMTALKTSINDDVESVATVIAQKNLGEKIMKRQRATFELAAKKAGKEDVMSIPSPSSDDAEGFGGLGTGWSAIESSFHRFNQAAGIEWMTLPEWYEAFNEVIESIKEVRKRKSRGRVARAALQIGHVASLIPGLGGTDLVNVLEEQQQAKNDEVKDAFIKELKNNRVDYGFQELFGDGTSAKGLLAFYHQMGDTNRTRAILEFAAGKGLLYEIGASSADKFMLPGGIPFRELMPTEWSNNQVNTWFNNLQFQNTQGMVAQEKAGEDFVKGRATVEGYLGPFKGSVKGLSLWFAKGIANKALSKVKEGEMSALLALAVLREWETNELFRRYVDMEWLDRLAGDSKQLMIGMIKYDKGHLLEGARGIKNPRNITHKIADAHDEGKAGKQRLGPLVNAVRNYIVQKDPNVRPVPGNQKSQDEFDLLVAKVLACKVEILPNGKSVSIFAPALRPYHIQYDPNEIRDAAVDKIGDDFFIERSELINSSAEVMQYVGKVVDQGFAEPTKARYFFSHIIDAYQELNGLGIKDPEMARAAQNFKDKLRPNLDQWITRNLQAGVGSDKLLTEYHSDQGLKGKPKRLLVATLLQEGLISLEVVQQLASKNVKAAKTLLDQYGERGPGINRGDATGGGARSSPPSVAA
jgi:hypothetical protein